MTKETTEQQIARFKNEFSNHHKLMESSPEKIMYDFIKLEMRYRAGLQVAQHLAWLAQKWKEEKNPYYMDRAALICEHFNVEPSETLKTEITAATQYRYKNHDMVGSPTKIENKLKKEHAYILMLNLIYHGESLPKAASKIAMYMDKLNAHVGKASSLIKSYKKDIEKEGIQEFYFNEWDAIVDEETRQQWLENISNLPEADDDLLGTRR